MFGSILIIAFIVLGCYIASHRLNAVATILALGALTTGITLVAFPMLAQRVADAVHIGRGVDLLMYVAIFAGLFVSANFYFRFKRIESQLTIVVRAMALNEEAK